MTDQPGTLTIDGDIATLTYRRRLPYSVETVWRAITDPRQRLAWFGETTIEPRVGGQIDMMPTEPPAAPEAKRMTGRILEPGLNRGRRPLGGSSVARTTSPYRDGVTVLSDQRPFI